MKRPEGGGISDVGGMKDGDARMPGRRLQSPDIVDDRPEACDQIALVPAMLLLQIK